MWLLRRRRTTEGLLFSFFSWALSNSAIPSRRWPRSRHSNRSSASSGLNITVRLLSYFQVVTISINMHSFTGSCSHLVTFCHIPNPSPYPPPPPQRSSSDITIDSPCSIHGSEEDRFAPSGREGGRGRLRGAAVSASAASSLSSRGGRFVIVSLLYSWNDEQMRRRRRSGNKNH